MAPNAPRILLSAGEPSGDLHGAGVARALRRRWPHAELYGLGGPRMAAEGVRLVAHVDELAVMGFAEVAARLPFFLRLLRTVRRDLRTNPPDLVIPIDYPGFNMRLARSARESGIPVLYYIAPQVWAWHSSRVRELAANVDRLAVILPFEEKIFAEGGARAVFVGHPLLDAPPEYPDRATFCAQHGLDAARPILALFPGSRQQEIKRQLALFEAAAGQVVVQRPDVQPVIAAGADIPADAFAQSPYPRSADTWGLLHHARAALVKSGTSTLQAALSVTPLVVTYRMHPLSYAIARRLVEVDHVGLVNLVAGERIAAELIQHDATPAALASALIPLLDDGPERERALTGLRTVRAKLRAGEAEGSAADRVAELAAEILA